MPTDSNPASANGEPWDDRANRVEDARHLAEFSGKLSFGLSKPAQRFVDEALYGIAARGSVRLSEIGRALEETIPLIKTETRLSRNLGREELREHLGGAVLQEGSARIRERTLLVLDLSDIAKPYAEKMEYLARVRDGSTGGLANGYWLCQVIGVENEDSAVVPLYSALYSQRAPDFQSENEEIKTALSEVSAACGGRGVWVVDRGGDRGELYTPLLDGAQPFIIRSTGARHLFSGPAQGGDRILGRDLPVDLRHPHRARREGQGDLPPPRLWLPAGAPARASGDPAVAAGGAGLGRAAHDAAYQPAFAQEPQRPLGGWSAPISPAGASRKRSASSSKATIWKTSGC